MSDFQVLAPVKELERFSTDKGEFVVFEIGFSGDQGRGTIRHKRKSSSPAPAPGDVIDGEIVHGKDGPELKRIWKQQAGGNGSGGGGGRSYGKSPEERAQIARMNAHGHALKYWEMKYAADASFHIASWKDYLEIVDLFYADVKAAA